MLNLMLIGFVQAFFLAFFLLTKKKKQIHDYILFVLLMLSGMTIYHYYSFFHPELNLPKSLQIIGATLPLAIVPNSLIYVVAVSSRIKRFNRWFLLCFLPFIFFASFYIIADMNGTIDLNIFNGVIRDAENHFFYSQIFLLSGAIYPVLSLVILKKNEKTLEETHSYKDAIDLKWLYFYVIYYITSFVLIYLLSILKLDIGVELSFKLIAVVLSVGVFILGFYGFKQRNIFTSQEHEIQTKAKYEGSRLSEEQLESYFAKLIVTMDTEKPYLDPKLTLHQLANKVEISLHHLSQVINSRKKMNFFEFINFYRVEHFKKALNQNENQQFTMLSIALDSGFNSKSTFNQIFKKMTGMTPSAYKKSLDL